VAKGDKTALLESEGIDSICEMVIEGSSYTEIARNIGVSVALLSTWIATDPERSARAREARIFSARTFDDKAIEVIKEAKDQFELTKARELASHYRWKASKISPDYSDRLQIDQRTTLTDLTDEQLDAKLASILGADQIAKAANTVDSGREGEAQG